MVPGIALSASILAAAATRQVESLAKWYEGPVRYLMTRREEKEYKAIKEDAARTEYIRTFWRRKDPIPETPENEARIAFWPVFFWGKVSLLTQPFVTDHPKAAFQLLCVKEIQ